MNQPVIENPHDTPPREPKPYSEPELVEYGDVETLTRGGDASDIDLFDGSQPI